MQTLVVGYTGRFLFIPTNADRSKFQAQTIRRTACKIHCDACAEAAARGWTLHWLTCTHADNTAAEQFARKLLFYIAPGTLAMLRIMAEQ